MLVSEFSLMLSFFITQLSATSTSRAAFMQCLRWGIWCPFQEPDVWKGEKIQLVLQGGARPNPHGVMVYSTQTSAKTQGSAPLSALDTAQVTQRHREYIFWRNKWLERCWFQHSHKCFPEISHYLNSFFGMWCIRIFDKLSLLGGFHIVPIQGDITSYFKALHCASSPQFKVHFCLQVTVF